MPHARTWAEVKALAVAMGLLDLSRLAARLHYREPPARPLESHTEALEGEAPTSGTPKPF